MHPNPAFRREAEGRHLSVAGERGLGTLCLNGARLPILAHVPFLLDHGVARFRLVRSDPALRALPARGAPGVMCPDGYVSPDWYGVPDQVPTWNHVAVQLEDPVEPLAQDSVRSELDAPAALMREVEPG